MNKDQIERLKMLQSVCGIIGNKSDATSVERETHFHCETACHASVSYMGSDSDKMEELIVTAERWIDACRLMNTARVLAK